jgi:RimJ/RimL family protein N-acetyltransferase
LEKRINMYQDKELVIRPIEERDFMRLWELIYKDDAPEWKKWDAPYFPHQSMPFERFMERAASWLGREDRWVIAVNDLVCGVVSYYFEDEQKRWLEIGIAIHESNNWNRGIGTRSLALWIDHIFKTLPLPRVGLTTWSGNERMIAVGEKLGMQMEARIRKVRYHEGQYFDSIRMGILMEEWEERKNKSC